MCGLLCVAVVGGCGCECDAVECGVLGCMWLGVGLEYVLGEVGFMGCYDVDIVGGYVVDLLWVVCEQGH